MKLISVGIASGMIARAGQHVHSYDEIILTLSGSGIVTAGEQERGFYPGSIECIPAGMPHGKRSKDRFRDVFLGVEGFELLREGKLILLEDDADKSVETILLAALRAYHREGQRRVAEALAEAVCAGIACKAEQPVYDDEVERLKNHIIENYTDPDFSIGAAESGFGYCADHMRRRFKRATGQTPGAYLTRLRLEYARDMLNTETSGSQPIGNLALMAGFYDAHYFARLFKRYTGMTPTQYAQSVDNFRPE